jgi:hypothetical protein
LHSLLSKLFIREYGSRQTGPSWPFPRSPMWRAYENRRDSLARYGAQPARASQGLPLPPSLNAFSLRKNLEMRGRDPPLRK